VVLKFHAGVLRYVALYSLVLLATSSVMLFFYPLQFLLDSFLVGLLVLANSLSPYGALNFKPLWLIPNILRIPKEVVYGELVVYNIGWILICVPLVVPPFKRYFFSTTTIFLTICIMCFPSLEWQTYCRLLQRWLSRSRGMSKRSSTQMMPTVRSTTSMTKIIAPEYVVGARHGV
jgi:hypothetical protein